MSQHRAIGSWRGISIEVAVWDGVSAEVDLSCAGMFEHELGNDGPKGGLAHLDAALDGALTLLRREGHFRAGEGETLLITHPTAAVAAARVLIVGLGSPADWTVATMARAVATAFRCGTEQEVRSIAFAPGMLDGGLDPSATGLAPDAMLSGLARAIDAERRLAELGLAEPSRIERWVFDVGEPRFDAAADRFAAALAALTPTALP